MTVNEMIKNASTYISSKGYQLADGLTENLFLGLQTKSAVLLAGDTDIPKAIIARLFAQALGADEENGRFKMLQVQPDWLAPSDLYGRVNLEGVFLPGAIIDFLKQAQQDPDNPYFLCMDGIGISSAEYYLNDLVSGLLAKHVPQQERLCKPLVTEAYFREDTTAAQKYGTICTPENLYLIGTVHMDQASFPLNQRFLDRVHTIRVLPEDITVPAQTQEVAAQAIPNSVLMPHFTGYEREGEYWHSILEYFAIFQQINSILTKARAYVEYTLRDQVVVYLMHNKRAGLMDEDMAMDLSLIQYVLPRLQGSKKMVMDALCRLFAYCAGTGTEAGEGNCGEQFLAAAKMPGCKYPRTAETLAQMVCKCEKDDFTSLWL